MSVARMMRLMDCDAGDVEDLDSFFARQGCQYKCTFVTSAFRRLRQLVERRAAECRVAVLNAVEGGDAPSNCFRLGAELREWAGAATGGALLVMLDQPKVLFEGADRMSEGLQLAIDELCNAGWECCWYSIVDADTATSGEAHARLSEWLGHGVGLSRALLGFCSIEAANADEHGLRAVGSKGHWLERFGQVRLVACRAILASVRRALDADPATSAVVALAVRMDNLKPSDLNPAHPGWNNMEFDGGWINARATEAALLWSAAKGRLPDATLQLLRQVVDPDTALGVLAGISGGRDAPSYDAEVRGLRRIEALLRTCRNKIAHAERAPDGTYSVVSTVLIAAELWAQRVRQVGDVAAEFPDTWSEWNRWGDDTIKRGVDALRKPLGAAENETAVEVLARIEQRQLVAASRALMSVGGELGQLARKRDDLAALGASCRGMKVHLR
jgi:hypothetical protein